jgi:hypothetical protein
MPVAVRRRPILHPALLFALGWAVLLALLFAPLLAGGVAVNPMSDMKDGYVTRHFAAEVIRSWGEIPRWDPYIFGGLPFLGAMHGDQAYPITVALRAIFSPALAIGLGMVLHLWLAAVGMLIFLRRLRLSWGASVVGATAYGIGGPLIGLMFPGHDGKIFVLGLLPWALTAILEAARTARLLYFAAWGALLGLMLLSPHFQMAYYCSLLMAAFLLLELRTDTPPALRWKVVAGMALGSIGGLLLAGAQLLPFIAYLPFSPRSAPGSTSTGWEYATSFAMPAPELIGSFWGGFNGWLATYWGSNPFQLNSEYLGLLVGVLGALALWRFSSVPRRPQTWFWAGAFIFGVLWALGAQTPFYRLPYTLFPGISKTRAPGMIWGQVSLVTAVLAAFGFSRIEALSPAERERWGMRATIATVIIALILAAVSASVLPSIAPEGRESAALAAIPGAQLGIFLGALTVVVVAVVAWKAPRWLPVAAVAVLLVDLGVQDKRYISIDPRGNSLYAADSVVRVLQHDAVGTTQPWRVLPAGAYLDDYLIEHRIRSVLGYHGNELHRYDELLGGKGVYSELANPQLWNVLAVRYILTPGPINVPGLTAIASNVPTWLGEHAWIYRLPDPAPWARVVPLAIRASDEETMQAVRSPRFDPNRVVAVAQDAPFGTTPSPQQQLPAPLDSVRVRVTERQPGVYVMAVEGLRRDGVLVVSENWMPDWTAHVDGRVTPVARANATLIAIPLAAGSKEVVLSLDAVADRRGRYASMSGLALLILMTIVGLRQKNGPSKETVPARPAKVTKAA